MAEMVKTADEGGVCHCCLESLSYVMQSRPWIIFFTDHEPRVSR
jgi:hypothetical protein